MKIAAFTDQYEMAAALYEIPAADLRQRDESRTQPRQRWLAIRDGDPAGAVTAWLRPDRRMFLSFVCPDAAAYGPLTEATATDLRRSLYTILDAGDGKALDALRAAGFVVEVVEERFRVRFDRALALLERAQIPPGFSILPADAVDEDRLFTLDNTIRQDVPGTDGWRGDRQWFREEISESPPFDPRAYLVAVDDHNGEYAGLVRVWRNPDGPRLGLIGIIPQYRNTSLGPALLRQGLAAASGWGEPSFVTETSPTNRGLYRWLKRAGAESLGQFVQLVRR